MKQRLDRALVELGFTPTRSQAESWIKLGKVFVDGKVVSKTGQMVGEQNKIELRAQQQYVSRAALKLASIAQKLNLDFKDKVVLDVGSSTGGFTDFALKNGASKVIAVDVGTNQMHPSLRGNPKIELFEKTDIRDLAHKHNIETPDIVLADVSFISLREVLPAVASLSGPNTSIVAMVKPQFEAGDEFKHKGVVKNDRMRREILKQFEQWSKKYFAIVDKADSGVAGSKGNLERFYLLRKVG